MNKLTGLMIFALLPLSNCDSSHPRQARYEWHQTPSERAYLLDTKTGQVSLITPDGIFKLTEGTPVLKVGEYLWLENSARRPGTNVLEYMGNGKFEPREYAIRKLQEVTDVPVTE